MLNFLKCIPLSFCTRIQERFRLIIHRRTVRIILYSLIGFGIIFGLITWRGVIAAQEIIHEARAAQQSLTYAHVAVGVQEFSRAKHDLSESQQHFERAQKRLHKWRLLKILPGARTQYSAVTNLLNAALQLTRGLQPLTDVGKRITESLGQTSENISLADIDSAQKHVALQAIAESTADLQGARADIELAMMFIEEIPSHYLLSMVRDVVTPVREQLPILESIITQIIPFAQALPTIVGFPKEQTYLFLLQNNRELRPTGGFIGTFGIVKILDGEITSFDTENTYNLDEPMKDTIQEQAPAPIRAHTSSQVWLLRDANWSPDFPTSAKKARDKYWEEGGQEKNIDGVIAVTPSFIASLLELTGPIKINGANFTAENLFEKLQYDVEFGFVARGENLEGRKEIIGDLGTQLLEQLFRLPKNRFQDIWEAFVRGVHGKQILLYSENSLIEQLVIEENWGGEMKKPIGDFFMIVDANLAALKTDNVMERGIQYRIENTNDGVVSSLDVTYKNNGKFSNIYTRYRSWTRVYLPFGTTLLDAQGFMTNDKLHNGKPIAPEVYEEEIEHPDGSKDRYTVVAGFFSVEPKEEITLHFQYRAVPAITSAFQQGKYILDIQKQPGTNAHAITLTILPDQKFISTFPLDATWQFDHNIMRLSTDLSVDRHFEFRAE